MVGLKQQVTRCQAYFGIDIILATSAWYCNARRRNLGQQVLRYPMAHHCTTNAGNVKSLSAVGPAGGGPDQIRHVVCTQGQLPVVRAHGFGRTAAFLALRQARAPGVPLFLL